MVDAFFMDIHIGKHIQKQMKEQGRSASWLARQLCCDRTNIYKIYNKKSIDTDVLQKISYLLGYNFFDLYNK